MQAEMSHHLGYEKYDPAGSSLYPILFLDALKVCSRENAHVQNRPVYVAIGINMDGKRVPELWSSSSISRFSQFCQLSFWYADRNREIRAFSRRCSVGMVLCRLHSSVGSAN